MVEEACCTVASGGRGHASIFSVSALPFVLTIVHLYFSVPSPLQVLLAHFFLFSER